VSSSEHSQSLHFRFQRYAKLFFHLCRYLPHQAMDICRCCISCVDNKTTVLLRNFCTAHLKTGKSGILDQLPGEISFRTLKGTPGTWILQRLFCNTSGPKIIHPGLDLFRIACAKLNLNFQCNITLSGNDTGAVAHFKVLPVYSPDLTGTVQHCDTL